MKTALSFVIIPFLLILSSSFFLYEHTNSFSTLEFGNQTPDTTFIGNRAINSGGKIMTDQDALVVIVPTGKRLAGISMYYSNVNTINSDSSRLFVKSERSWSCAPLGNANPLQVDQFTLGLTNNLEVKTGWNDYVFDSPIVIPSDTIYIWPDLIQQVHPRVVWAHGNHNSLGSLTGTSCATLGSDISVLDYSSELIFVSESTCPPFLFVTDSDSICYAADTLHAKTTIDPLDSITYLSKHEVLLDSTFTIDHTAQFVIDMNGCN